MRYDMRFDIDMNRDYRQIQQTEILAVLAVLNQPKQLQENHAHPFTVKTSTRLICLTLVVTKCTTL